MTRVDRWWDRAIHYSPVLFIFLVLAPLAGVLVPRQYQPVAVGVLAIMVTGYLGASVVPLIARMLRKFFRSFEGRTTIQEEFVSGLVARHWSVSLCHALARGDSESLLADTLRRVAELDSRFPRAEEDDSLLLCPDSAITSESGRDGVAAARNTTRLSRRGDVIHVVHRPGHYKTPDPVVVKPPAGTMWMLAFPLIFIPFLAMSVSDAEKAACAGTSCEGRPDGYLEALLWLIGRLTLTGDIGSATPATTTAEVFGFLTMAMGIVCFGLLVSATIRYSRYRRQAVEAGRRQYEIAMSESARAAFGGVFVNYRRGGHNLAVAAIHRELGARFGMDKVFMDVASMAGGTRYPDELRRGLSAARVLVVVIHSTWLEELRPNTPTRLDWVQYEIEQALAGQKRIIPVLLDGAELPEWEKLPEPIRDFVRRQNRPLRSGSFHDDMHTLVADIEDAAREGIRTD